MTLCIKNARHLDAPVDLLVRDGKIVTMTPAGHHAAPEGSQIVDARGLILMPSMVDAHVHLREPGFEYKEDINTGLEAAARGGEHVGHQLGGDGVTGLGLAVLPGIAEVRDDGGDAAGGGALHRVDHDQQLHEAVVDRLAGALHDEHVHAADGLVDGDGALAVGKRRDRALAQGDAEVLADHVRQVGVGRAGEHLDLFAVWNLSLIHI